MLEDHSSRWSAAASPGGLIGLVLTILSVITVISSVLSLSGRFEIPLNEALVYGMLAGSALVTLLLIYLLFAYLTMSYRIDTEALVVRWGLWKMQIPFSEIAAVAPAEEVLGDGAAGWQPFWPGYYVGTRGSELGQVRVISTLPPRRQILIARSDGEIFAISPERPLLFMEELARWHEAYEMRAQAPDPASAGASQDFVVSDPVPERTIPPPPAQPAVFGYRVPEPVVEESQPVETVAEHPFAEPDPDPHSQFSPGAGQYAADESPAGEPSFGYQPEPVSIEDIDTARFTLPEIDPPEDEEEPFIGPVLLKDEPAPDEGQSAESKTQDSTAADDEQSPLFGPPVPATVIAVSVAEPEPEPSPNEPVFGYSASQAPTFGVPVQQPSPVETQEAAGESPEQQPVAEDVPADAADPGKVAEADESVEDESDPTPPPPEVWAPPRPREAASPIAVQQFVDAGWTAEYSTLDVVSERADHQPSSPPQSSAPAVEHVVERPVLQPLTRVQRSRPVATSPALRPTLLSDPVAIALMSLGLLATAAMVIFVLVRYDDIPPSLTLHWNVDGLPGRVGEPQEIWILPVIAGLVLFANIGLAWSIAMFDKFAARLMLGSTIIVHLTTWVALIMILR